MAEPRLMVVESHNGVLPFWYEASNLAGGPLALITFDSHTDTRDASKRLSAQFEFGKRSWLEKAHAKICDEQTLPDYKKALVEDLAVFLHHDEHIVEAFRINVLQHVDIVLPCKPEGSFDREALKVQDATEFEITADYHFAEDLFPKDYESLAVCASALQSNASDSRFILDIDLDFFAYLTLFYSIPWEVLCERACLITIARERSCYCSCCGDNGLHNDEALRLLRDRLRI